MKTQQKETKKIEEKNEPVKNIRISNVAVAIWKNETEAGAQYSFTFEKRYTDKNGEWNKTNSFSKHDLTALSFAIGEVVKYIYVDSKQDEQEE